MRPIYASDAQRIHADATGGHVELCHEHLDDNGNFTDYWMPLTPKDARRLARQLRAAAHEAEQAT